MAKHTTSKSARKGALALMSAVEATKRGSCPAAHRASKRASTFLSKSRVGKWGVPGNVCFTGAQAKRLSRLAEDSYPKNYGSKSAGQCIGGEHLDLFELTVGDMVAARCG